jgi:hypothetical protein
MDLDSFLVSLYVQIDDWWKLNRSVEEQLPQSMVQSGSPLG